MSPMLIVAWIVRWSGFVALAGLAGAFVVDRFIVPAAIPDATTVRRRLSALRVGCAALLLLDTGAELWVRAGTMSGGGAIVAMRAVPVVLTHTHFGSVWIARAVLLLALLPLSLASGRRLLGLGALGVAAVALTVSLTGHADDWGDLTPTAGIDWLHVVAATTWTGGLLVLAAIVLREAPRWPGPLLADTMRRFSRLAAWCLLAVVLSGAYASWVQVPSLAALWGTVYGRALTVKLLLVLGLIWWGAVNRYALLPRLGARCASGVLGRVLRLERMVPIGSSQVPSRLATYLTREVFLAMLVFGCSAVLTESTPARHFHHLGSPARVDEHAGHARAAEHLRPSPAVGLDVSR